MTATYTDRYLQVAGLKTRYRLAGTGPAVLLLHGQAIGSSLDVWDQHVPHLAAYGLQVIVFDQPGYGGTDDPPDYSPAFRRSFVLKLLDALEVERAGLVGHSGAGGVVVQLALDHPDRVTRVMVVATGSLLPPLEGVVTGGAPEDAWPRDREPTEQDIRVVLENQLYHHELITPELVQVRLKAALGHHPRPAGSPTAAPPTGPALWERLGELRVPLLMLYARDDRGRVPERAELFKARYPQLEIRVLDECKHLLHLDQPEAFIEAAGKFFSAA